MEALKEWVRGLVMLLILASCLELLLPMNGMKKYVRMAMGLLIVLGVVRPIVGLLGHPVAVEPGLLVGEESAIPSMSEITAQAGRFAQRNQALLLQEAEARLTAEARAAAQKVEGVSDARATLRLTPGGGKEEYRVEGVTVTVLLGSRYGRVRPVEPVRVPPDGKEPAPKGSAATGKEPAPASATRSPAESPRPPAEAEAALADAVRREVAARLGLTDARLIQVLVDRPGEPRR